MATGSLQMWGGIFDDPQGERVGKRLKVLLLVLSVTLLSWTANAFAADPAQARLPTAITGPASVIEGIKGSQFVGSDSCRTCHGKDHAAWVQTWHANMHRKVNPSIVVADFDKVEIIYRDVEIDGPDKKKVKIAPTVRLSREGDRFLMTLVDKDDPVNNQTYPVVFVLGGNWEQHFEVQVGDFRFPTPMRWVMADKQWRVGAFNNYWWIADGTSDGRPRKPGEMPSVQVGDAKCDGCHTTGFGATKDSATGRWTGNYASLGVGCESCHGPGGNHVKAPSRRNVVNPLQLNARQQDQLCAQCHSRLTNKSERDLAFPTGFVAGNVDLHDRADFWTYSTQPGFFWPNEFANKNRQQYSDIRQSGHQRAGVTCITCHSPHSTQKGYAQVRGDKTELCSSCHRPSGTMYQGSAMAAAGVSCVDCHMAKIASRATATAKTPVFWDTSSHTFRPVLPSEAADFKMRSSCDGCHGDDRAARSVVLIGAQQAIREKVAEVEAAIAVAKAEGKPTVEAQLSLDAVLRDGSVGAHNSRKAAENLNAALSRLVTGR